MTADTPKKLSHQTATGTGLLIGMRLATRGIDLLALTLLGRLLSPSDFGLVAIAMTLIFIVEAVLELPASLALIRLAKLTKAHLDTAFTLGVLRGLVLALIVGACAWPFAKTYNDPRLLLLIVVLGFAPILRSLTSPRMAEFAQKLDFKRDLIVEVSAKVLSAVISVGLAWYTKSYWAIAAGTIATPLIMVVTSYIVAPYAPRLSLSEWPQFSRFIGWSTLSQGINALNWQMAQLFIGKFIGPVAVGYYAMAGNIAALPYQVLTTQAVRPLTAAFSLIRDDSERLKSAYLLASASFITICIPVLVGLGLVAQPLIHLVLGERWLPSAHILNWLALIVLPPMFTVPFGPLAVCLNRARAFVWLSCWELCVKLLAFFLARDDGVAGVLMAQGGTAVALMAASMIVVRGLIHLPIHRQLLNPWRPVLSGLIMAAVIMPFQKWLSAAEGLQLMIGLASAVSLGAIVYIAALISLWRLAGCPQGVETKVFEALKPLRVRFS